LSTVGCERDTNWLIDRVVTGGTVPVDAVVGKTLIAGVVTCEIEGEDGLIEVVLTPEVVSVLGVYIGTGV
jgi:hypothetical protein